MGDNCCEFGIVRCDVCGLFQDFRDLFFLFSFDILSCCESFFQIFVLIALASDLLGQQVNFIFVLLMKLVNSLINFLLPLNTLALSLHPIHATRLNNLLLQPLNLLIFLINPLQQLFDNIVMLFQ